MRWVGAVALAASLLLGLGVDADAQDCSRATPLPADLTITPPAADVPAEVAKFSGAWSGRWADRIRSGACGTVVIEQVFPNGFARIVYSVGTLDPFIPQAQHWRAAARITSDALRFELPVPTRPEFTYRFAGADLAGTFKEGPVEATVTARRIADLSTVACPRMVSSVSPPGATRDRITATELLASAPPGDGLVHNDYFMPVGPVAPARHTLRGTLTASAGRLSGAWNGCAGLGLEALRHTLAFVTHGEHLVPVERGIIRVPAPPGWPPVGIIVSPGRVWSEAGDHGMSRASFPFVLVNGLDNGTHNGLATFLFDDTRVSNLRVQITQETNRWDKIDYWGQVSLTYVPGAVPNESRLRAEFDAERQGETPIKPWSAVPVAATSPWLGDAFDGSSAPHDISASGLVIDGVLYLRGCHTRTGDYPYCRHMRHGVFSVTKTLGAAVALLRLAAKYGDAVFDAKIADYVRVTATHDGWKDVTFGDALSMVVPIGDAGPLRTWTDPQPDETQPRLFGWVSEARSARDKLDRGFGYGRHPWARGEVVRYNTTVTFTLAAAMDAFLKGKEGPQAHLWDMVVDEVYRPIGIFHAPTMHTIEPDGSRGLPILGYGLTPTIDDVAKLATLLQARGRHGNAQILSAAKIDDALRPRDPGVSTLVPSRYGEQRYHRSFWSLPYVTALGCRYHVPYMWGYGGNFVVLLPNGISAFRFADGNIHDLETMILAGDAIRPFCTSAPTDAPPKAGHGAPLTASELQAELPGNTFGVGVVRVFIAPGGVAYLTAGGRSEVGRWRIAPEGLYCRTWTAADNGLERCHHVYRDGETFTFHVHDRWTAFRWTRTLGRGADF